MGSPARLALLLLVLANASVALGQPIRASVVSGGFPAPTQTGYVARDGQWIPIRLQLVAAGTEPIQYSIHCERQDLDGDRVDFTAGPAILTPGAEPRDVWCYVVTQPESDRFLRLDIVSRDGLPITSIDVPEFEPIPARTRLLLDLSEPALTFLQEAADRSGAVFGGGLEDLRFYRELGIGRLPPEGLPDRWWGLEAVNIIVWDRPDPSRLNDAQLDALVTWVRNGGQLVLGLGDAWRLVRQTRLASVIPLEGDEPTLQVDDLPIFRERLVAPDAEGFENPVGVAAVSLRSGWPAFTERVGTRRTVPLIATDLVGSGRVVVTAASLRDLTSLELRRETFISYLVDFDRIPPAVLSRESEQPFGVPAVSLYRSVVRPIEFQTLGSALVVLAFLFVAVYVLVSTWASWIWLKRYSLTHLSWSVFAALSVVGSVLSLGAVQLTRGCQDVAMVSFVDLTAGSTDAVASTLVGYKSAARQRDDLALPSDEGYPPGYLRALAQPRGEKSHYATSERYQAFPARGMLTDVLLRATLKQFEGFWCGKLEGTVRGKLTVSRLTGRVTPESWLESDLPVPLAGGVLLYIDPRISDELGYVPLRASGLTRHYRADYRGSSLIPPAAAVLAVDVPALAPGTRITQLGRERYAELDRDYQRWSAFPQPNPVRMPEPPTLWDYQLDRWLQAVAPPTMARVVIARFDPDIASALLLSTANLYLHNAPGSGSFDTVGSRIRTDGLLDRDICKWLMRNQAVLLAWSPTPGPARLHRDGRPLAGRSGLTLYRVRIPLEYVGQPPPAGGQASDATGRAGDRSTAIAGESVP